MHARRIAYGAILSAAIVAGSSAHAVVGPGGTIVFTGALFAPSYSISTGRTAHSGASTTQSVSTQKDTNATTVTFTALPGGLPSADITLTASGERFIDGNNRRIKPNKNGAYHIAATGGVLSIPTQAANTIAVFTNYQ